MATNNSGIREVPFGTSNIIDAGLATAYPNNVVVTSKYTFLTFVPKNLMEQLQKMANVYFLFITIVMYISEVTDLYVESIKAYSTGLTLFMMMAWSALMAAIDDYHRHVADSQMNSQPAHAITYRGSSLAEGDPKTWADVKVGDVLVVRSEQEFPADMIPLACSGDEGTCYVSTANLDGETNLKIKYAVASTQASLCGSVGDIDSDTGDTPLLDQVFKCLAEIGGTISAEAPQRSIHTFTGSIRSAKDSKEEALDAKQILLRGTMLRNTAWVVGVVVYTGTHTRVVMNSRKTPMKLANLEKVINMTMIVVLCTQFALAVASDVAYNMEESTFKGYSYLTVTSIDLPNALGFLFTFFVLYSNLMPISLYATMEVCNTAQGYFIKSDIEMYDDETDSPAMVRSTNLAQELGQVEYIFSDKTGTLTQNVMELKRVSIAGKIYGHTGEERGFQGDKALQKAKLQSSTDAEAIDAFLEVLAVSHTVVVNEDQDGSRKYEAESPDEGALVQTAGELGWNFVKRAGSAMTIEVGKVAEKKMYTVLALNAFNSTRKRMSVVVKTASGENLLLVKGADNVMLERAKAEDTALENHLNEMAAEGLRTLVIGRRKLTDEEFSAWQSEYNTAQVALENRDGALMDVAEKIEKELELVGATGIEDKLQVGVGGTIERIRLGGIKLWVLTGDKLETARNIGFSTKVLTNEMEIPVLNEEELEPVRKQLAEVKEQVRTAVANGTVVGLMVTGQALGVITENQMDSSFLELGVLCSVVIACRVSPLQKAQMVALVRNGVKPTPVTLAVGDGANDVPMIQEARVGVGIVGKEGRQAVNAADFAIGQFRFLQRLLLVHGRWNYRRACKLTLYTFWRNAVQVLLMFYYSFVCGSSGTTIFEDKTRMTFNFILSIPIMATGSFDRDVEDTVVLDNPKMYETGRLGLDLNPMKMVATLLNALGHSLVMLAVMMLALPGMNLLGVGDVYTWGTSLYSILIMDGNYRCAFLTGTWNWVCITFFSLSFFLYILFCVVYGVMTFGTPVMKTVTHHMAGNAPFWICLVVVPALTMVLDLFFAYVQLRFRPDIKDVVMESLKRGEPSQMATATENARQVSEERENARQTSTETPMSKASSEQPYVSSNSALRASSYAFDHPDGSARSHSNLKIAHPKAGDTSVVDKLMQSAPETFNKKRSLEKVEKHWVRSHRPAEKPLSQQKLKSFQVVFTPNRIVLIMFLAGAVVTLLGVLAWVQSQSVAQIRIHYHGEFTSWPHGTKDEETYKKSCANGDVCTYTVSATKDMEPPIWLFYGVDPFYQNYNSYLQTVAKRFSDKTPIPNTFTDTFAVAGMKSDIADIAWVSDLERFGCSPGSACVHDVVWTRPGAMPQLEKPRMTLSGKTIKKGENLTITINAASDTRQFGARKEVFLTTLSSLGGRNDSFGLFLIISGVGCLLVSVVIVVIQRLCPRTDTGHMEASV